MRKIVSISLPSTVAQQVDDMVAQGGYASTSELFRDLLRGIGRRHDDDHRMAECRAFSFRVSAFMSAVKKHARKGAKKTLSRDHDRYLYGK